jgi:hypothetical protein
MTLGNKTWLFFNFWERQQKGYTCILTHTRPHSHACTHTYTHPCMQQSLCPSTHPLNTQPSNHSSNGLPSHPAACLPSQLPNQLPACPCISPSIHGCTTCTTLWKLRSFKWLWYLSTLYDVIIDTVHCLNIFVIYIYIYIYIYRERERERERFEFIPTVS